MSATDYREPVCISQFKTFPGGNRRLKRRDPKYQGLWRLMSHALHSPDAHAYQSAGITLLDKADCLIEVKVSCVARRLQVSRNTISAWLSQYEANSLIHYKNRYGGRGRGIVLEMSWHKRGLALAAKRKTALKYKQQKQDQKVKNLQTAQQRQTALKHPTGDFNKNRACKSARLVLTTNLSHSKWRFNAISALCKWIRKSDTTHNNVTRLLHLLKTHGRLRVPKWVRQPADVHRWMNGLINNLLSEGRRWFETFELKGDLRSFPKILERIESATLASRPCPVCEVTHTQWEYETGMSENGGLSCLGWAREKLADFRDLSWQFEKEAYQEQPQSTDATDAWAQWRAEQAEADKHKRLVAEQAREQLRQLKKSFSLS